MRSTGNDIIDLSQVNRERSNQRRFYSKFLAASEETLYEAAACPNLTFEQFVWMAWSVKESGYKFLKRHQPQLVFSPVRVVVTQLQAPARQSDSQHHEVDAELCYTGSLLAGGGTYYFRSRICPDSIASVVGADAAFPGLNWAVHRIPHTSQTHQSTAVRHALLGTLERILPKGTNEIAKAEAGYPVILHNNQPLDMPVSFSHHNAFISYSFLLP